MRTIVNRILSSRLTAAAVIAGALVGVGQARADGCYVCEGTRTYARFRGADDWAKRRKAEACGCKVQSLAARCDAPGAKVLCTVEIRASRPAL